MALKQRKTGFTLIEILVTITIIGILAALGLASYSSVQMKARDARRKSDLQSMARALEAYYNDFKGYPLSTGEKIRACGISQASACDWGQAFSVIHGSGTIDYMLELPTDPNGNYNYEMINNKFYLFARLENLDDKDVLKDNSGLPQGYDTIYCRSGGKRLCNYVITSSNATKTDALSIGPAAADN